MDEWPSRLHQFHSRSANRPHVPGHRHSHLVRPLPGLEAGRMQQLDKGQMIGAEGESPHREQTGQHRQSGFGSVVQASASYDTGTAKQNAKKGMRKIVTFNKSR